MFASLLSKQEAAKNAAVLQLICVQCSTAQAGGTERPLGSPARSICAVPSAQFRADSNNEVKSLNAAEVKQHY